MTCTPCELAAAEAVVDVVPEATNKQAKWAGPIGIENQTTGDGRHIKTNALRWDTLPVPLRWAMQDFGAHDGAYVVGKIAEVERLSYDETNKRLVANGRDPLPESFKDAVIIWGSGTYDLGSEYGREAFRQVDEELTPGISMDLDDVVVEEDDDGNVNILEGRVRAATQVAIPAFEGARISTTKEAIEEFDPDKIDFSESLVAALKPLRGEGFLTVSEELFNEAVNTGLAVEIGVRPDDGVVLYDLNPVFNWVEEVGGLPPYIKRIEKHLQRKGMTESHAIATAVNVVEKMCATGDTNFPGAQQVNAGSRAEACAAIAEWEEKKARARADNMAGTSQTIEGVKVQPVPETKQEGTKEQVRVPKGNPDGGRWMDTPGSVASEADESLARAEWLENRDELRSSVRDAAEALTSAKIGSDEYKAATEALRAALGDAQEQIKGMKKVAAGSLDADAADALIGVLDEGAGKLAEYLRTDWSLGEEDTDIGAHALLAGAHVRRPAEWFENPRLREATGLTVTEDGRVFGHIALWGTCHIAQPQGKHVCTQPPRSASNYAYFHTGMTPTTAGDLPTGKITMSTLHAGEKLNANDTIYHYEHTGAVGADVVAGEDSYGIWVAGAARPGADLLALKAAPISGDWRLIGRGLELVGALSVNVPGFPVPRTRALVAAGGVVQSLVASGMVAEKPMTFDLSDDTVVLALRERFRALDRLEKANALAAKVARLNALDRIRRVAAALPFAYNKDQWRVPKGNPKGGQWVDMPDLALADLDNLLQSVFETADVDEGVASQIGDSLANAREQADAASAALKAMDGPNANAAAKGAARDLSDLELQLQDLAEGDALDEDMAAQIGEKIAAARDAVELVRDSDLSLLGDEGVDTPETDIGGEDETVVGDTPEAPAGGGNDVIGDDGRDSEGNIVGEDPGDVDPASEAPALGSVQQQAGTKAEATASVLEQTLMDVSEFEFDEDSAQEIGAALSEFRDAMARLNDGVQGGSFKEGDLADAQANLQDLERLLMEAADGPNLSDESATKIGMALDDMFADLGAFADTLKGSTEPPPFAHRKYVRQHLGRKGIRLGVTRGIFA